MLFEGRVDVESLEAGVATVKLTAGQQYIDEGGKIEVRQLGDSARAPSWQQGFIEFDDQPLGNAVEIMNRYSAEKIVIDSPAVASLRVSGQFRAGESLRFAKTLAEMHRLDVVQQGNQIRLGPRS
jgi:transmembrane sensor